MSYPLLKIIHIYLALASIAGFALRWWWMNSGSPLLQTRPVRILPHVIDTLFLAAGIGLAVTIGQYPFVHGWLTAKVLGLIAYIVLGTLALKRAKTPRGRTLAFVAALVTFAWVVSMARSKNPLGFLQFPG
jgi:uncharacterized membrane protein SirB2